MRDRGLCLDDLDRLQVPWVFHGSSERAALAGIGPFAGAKGGEAIDSGIWEGKSFWKLR